MVISGNRSTDSWWFFDCHCFGLFNMGMGMVMRFFLVFVVCFFISSIVLEVVK